jgi:Spy/CpxP family protein refolding chaperone
MVMGLLTVTAWQVGFAADSARSSPAHTRGGSGFLARLDRSVGLTPEQRDAVHGLLAAQRQSSQELREQTDAKIRARAAEKVR